MAHELEWDQAKALKEFRRAMELKPGYAYGIHWYGHFLESQGRAEEGRAELNRALALDPLNVMYSVDLAMNNYKLRRFDAALADLEQVKKASPDFPFLDLMTSMIYTARRDWPQALTSLQRSRERLGPMPVVLGYLGQAQALSGNRAAAQRTLTELEMLARHSFVPASCFAILNYALGDRDKGFSYMRQAFDGHEAVLIWLKHAPVFDQAAEDSRAKALMDEAGT